MRRTDRVALLLLVAGLAMSLSRPADRAPAPEPVIDPGLTFEERVAAEEAIARVYYAHQIGVTEPFESAVPRSILEERVRTYLRRSAPDVSALDAELARMESHSRLPERLREIFSALGNDRRLMRECVARPALAGKVFAQREALGDAAASAAAAEASPVVVSPSCSDSWQPLVNPLGPTRAEHAAVWTGSLMLIWGGRIGNALVGNGARYDPATDTWTFMSQVDQPIRRADNVALWTGTRLIIWGGSDGVNTYYGDGSRYDPISDTWSRMSMLNAPGPRSLATAVWTGTRMILWGGSIFGEISPGVFSNIFLNSGALYDPAADTWTPTAAPASLQGRDAHVAVWTGKEMIVWSGRTRPPSPTALGNRYDPATDTWQPIATAGQPVQRLGASVAWTGSRMIVWGGFNPIGPFAFDDGGRYDPQSDAWTPMATSGAPSARFAQTGVWTGHELVIWGGRGLLPLNSGARYNPAADTWTTMTLANVPEARERHSAVWTGTAMLVWGGNTAPTLADGGLYDPGGGGDFDQDGYSACAGDCNDDDASISPGAHETCNGRDDNCDGQVDEGLGSSSCGTGACERTVESCVDGVPQTCVPGEPVPEICNGVDDNCDGQVDEGPAGLDSDADGIHDACDACPFDPANDADGDGVCGDVDQCAASSLGGTVRIGDCDSGVANDALANGCTFQDLVNGCVGGAKGVGKTARCVAAVTNDLVGRGLLSGHDKGRIQSCAGGRLAPAIPHVTRQTPFSAVRPPT